MKAIILSAGYGKRLHPLTKKNPKPLLKIGRETLLSNTLKFLKNYGVKEVIINVHYLRKQIVEYVKKNRFNLDIKIVEEKDKILDTGGGVLNAIKYFSFNPFIVINPDTIWNLNYLEELSLMEDKFFQNKKSKCVLLVVNKEKSFDKSFRGDFSFQENSIIQREKNNLDFIYTGLQIIDPKVFSNINKKIFSMNTIWDQLISKNELNGLKSNIDFLHVSTLEIYNKLLKENFKY